MFPRFLRRFNGCGDCVVRIFCGGAEEEVKVEVDDGGGGGVVGSDKNRGGCMFAIVNCGPVLVSLPFFLARECV